MKTAGIIAEYNPLHTGHQYQLHYVREKLGADHIIIVMSGDYVQRGAPALFSKHLRAELALRCGADLVLELPVPFCCSSAESFARGGADLLDKIGVTDLLCFGSEAGNLAPFMNIAPILAEEPREYQKFLRNNLESGSSYPAARSEALLEYIRSRDDKNDAMGNLPYKHLPADSLQNFLASPNNILGLEYCKALLRLNSSIQPATLLREGDAYHTESTEEQRTSFPSSAGIRALLEKYSSMDPCCLTALEEQLTGRIPPEVLELTAKTFIDNCFVTEKDLDLLLRYRLLSETNETLLRYTDISPALAERICNFRNQYSGFSQFARLLKTKELTLARIRRSLLHIVLNIRDNPPGVPFARVLGFRKDAVSLLRAIKKEGRIPLLTKLADAPAVLGGQGMKLLEQNTYASNLYESLLCHKSGRPFRHEYEKPVVIL